MNYLFSTQNSTSNAAGPPVSLDQLFQLGGPSIFLFRAQGPAMEPLIFDGDIVVINRAQPPHNGAIVLGVRHGSYILNKLMIRQGVSYLCAENPRHRSPIAITEDMEFFIWGTVTGVVRHLYEKV